MSAIASLTVFDGAATPVSHTFLAESVSRDGKMVIATYKEAVASIPDYAQGRVTIKKTKLGSGVTRVSVRAEIPVMEAINAQNSSGYTAAPKVAYIDAAEYVQYCHERSTVAGRRLVRQLLTNIQGNVAVSVAPVATGPVPELTDLLVTPT